MSYQAGAISGKDKVGYYTDAEEDRLQYASSSHDNNTNGNMSIEVMSCKDSCTACRKDYCGSLPGTIESSLRNRYLFSVSNY